MKILKLIFPFLLLTVLVNAYSIPEYYQQTHQRQQLLQNKFGEESENPNLSPDYQVNEENPKITEQINELFNNPPDGAQEYLDIQDNLEDQKQDKPEKNPEGFQNFNSDNNYFNIADKEEPDVQNIENNKEEYQQTFQDFNQDRTNPNNINLVKDHTTQKLETIPLKKEENFNQENTYFNNADNKVLQEEDKTTQDIQQTFHDFNHLQGNQENFNNIQENEDNLLKTNRNKDANDYYEPDFKSSGKPVKEPTFHKEETYMTEEEKSYNKPKQNFMFNLKDYFQGAIKKASKKVADTGRNAWRKTKEFFTPKAKENTKPLKI